MERPTTDEDLPWAISCTNIVRWRARDGVQEDAMRAHPPRTDAPVRRRASPRRTPVVPSDPAVRPLRQLENIHPRPPRSARSRRDPARIGKWVEMLEQLV